MAIICHKETIAFALVPGTPASLGESPVWDSRCGGLWWVDPEGRRLSKSNASTGRARSWERPEMPCFAVLTGYGDPAVSMESGIFVFSERDVRCERIAELGQPRARFNDATVDASGRLWAATMDRRPGPGAGALYSISQNGRLVMHIDGISWPNGLACDDPHDRLHFSDSHPEVQAVRACDCNFATGRLGDRRVFADFNTLSGRPDAAALDSQGRYWIAGVDGGVLHVFEPDGTHVAEHPTPFHFPTKPAFGGPQLDRL